MTTAVNRKLYRWEASTMCSVSDLLEFQKNVAWPHLMAHNFQEIHK